MPVHLRLALVPPDQFLALAPRLAGRSGARSIIYNAAIARPDEAPAVAEIVFRIARVRLVDLIRTKNAGVNPAAARGRTVGLQFVDSRRPADRDADCLRDRRPKTTPSAISGFVKIGVPTIDLRQHGFHLRIAQLVFRIPPIERAQRFIERIVRLFRFGDQAQRELMHEPRFGSRVARRIDRFLAPLQHALRLRERAFLFRVTGRGKKKNFRFDFFAFSIRRARSRANRARTSPPSISTMSRTTSHFNFESDVRWNRELAAATAGFCPIMNMPSIFPSAMS